MFGSKLKIWMENHIGRSKRKPQQDKEKIQNEGRGLFLESSESLAQSDTGISSGSQQVLSSSTTDNKEGYCTTTMESDKSGITHCHTTVSLPSPESAYSTGYSTDGASPGCIGPPEYYINIRTGKHYFPSPAPTPTSPQPNIGFSQLYPISRTSFFTDGSLPPTDSIHKHLQSSFHLSTFVPDVPVKISPMEKQNISTAFGNFDIFNLSKSPSKKSPPKSQPLSSFKLFLKSPRKSKTDINKTPVFDNKKKILSPGKNKKWYKQPFQKFGCRRAEEENVLKPDIKKEVCIDKSISYLMSKENTASPRQRNRIKTNPWLPTEPMSTQNFHNLQINFSPNLVWNRSCTNTPLQNRKLSDVETLQRRIKQMNVKYGESKDYLNNLEKVVNRHIGQKLCLELSDHSEEDLTLNEMMGTYNESYVYEKETDILSDSDPTDCEDYVSDSEADNGGDERDSHDDELDFIDNGSITDSEDNFPSNTGKCTYVFVKKNSFLYKNDRHLSRKSSDSRKSFSRELDSKIRKSKEEKKRKPTRKSFKDENKKEIEKKIKPKAELNENVGGLNLGKVLMERMMAKKESKSADGTPVSIRRQKMMKELRETHIGIDKQKGEEPKKPTELLLVDTEADKKYNELIMEAENIFVSMQNSPVFQDRKKMATTNRKPNMESVEIWKKAETMCCPQFSPKQQQEISIRKSPKHLGLKLTMDETPKKFHQVHLDKKSSFKAKSSAHSPLDPLGPTFRNFTVFKPTNVDSKKISSSSSEDSEPNKTFKAWDISGEENRIPGSPIVPIAFQSVDLGKPLTSYCPQSEPVKRKIYSCSKTYDKLVKQFEKPTVFDENKKGRARHGSLMNKRHSDLEGLKRGSQGPLKLYKKKEKDTLSSEKCLCREVSYSPRLSPRRSSMPSSAASPNMPQRHSFNMDVFR